MDSHSTSQPPEFVPINESFPQQILSKHKTPSESALYRAKLLVLHANGRAENLIDAKQILLSFLDVQSPVQKEIIASVADLDKSLLTMIRGNPQDQSGLLAAVLEATLAIFQKSHCVFSWRKLSSCLEALGASDEANYIDTVVVRCIVLRDRPCHAASNALRQQIQEYQSIPGLGEQSGATDTTPTPALASIFNRCRTQTEDFPKKNRAWLNSYIQTLRVALQKAQANAEKIQLAALEDPEKQAPDQSTVESQVSVAEAKLGDGTQQLDIFDTMYRDFLGPNVAAVFVGRKFLPTKPNDGKAAVTAG